MKKTLEGINSRQGETKECTNDLEDGIMEFTQSEQKKKKRENSLRDL